MSASYELILMSDRVMVKATNKNTCVVKIYPLGTTIRFNLDKKDQAIDLLTHPEFTAHNKDGDLVSHTGWFAESIE